MTESDVGATVDDLMRHAARTPRIRIPEHLAWARRQRDEREQDVGKALPLPGDSAWSKRFEARETTALWRSALLFALLPLACGSSVTVAPDGAGGGDAASSATGISVSATGSGQGGSISASATSSAQTGAAGGGASCEDAYLDIEGDGPTQHLEWSCSMTWGASQSDQPVAYFFMGGGAPFTARLEVVACGQAGVSGASLRLAALDVDSQVEGKYPGSVEYTDAAGVTWYPTAAAADIGITKITVIEGKTVDGYYEGSVTREGDIKTLSGSFRACKVSDLYAP